MADFQISDHLLTKECDALAADIFADMRRAYEDSAPDDWRDEAMDRAHEVADGHEWVIYYHKALMVCAHCDVSEGEAFLEDVGMPSEVTFEGLATLIAFGEMRARIEAELDRLIREYEPDDADDVGNDV